MLFSLQYIWIEDYNERTFISGHCTRAIWKERNHEYNRQKSLIISLTKECYSNMKLDSHTNATIVEE